MHMEVKQTFALDNGNYRGIEKIVITTVITIGGCTGSCTIDQKGSSGVERFETGQRWDNYETIKM